MSPIVVPILLVAVSVASTTAGWVFRARGRAACRCARLTWAVISTQEFPWIFLLYRRIRPRRIRGEEPSPRA